MFLYLLFLWDYEKALQFFVGFGGWFMERNSGEPVDMNLFFPFASTRQSPAQSHF